MTQPLAGIKVLDLSRFIAGPYCGLLLGDLGADVVKVEKTAGEETRALHPRVGDESLSTMVFNRNKRGITINYRHPEGQALLRDLAKEADVLIENFRPGTMEQMGCGWDVLRDLNPRLVMVRVSGFGQDGPWATKPCFDVIGQAMSGLMEMTGQPGGPPTMAGTFVVDYATALYATIGTMGALQAREKTGRGQVVDVALLDSAVSFLMTAIPERILQGRESTRNGNRDRYAAPVNTFRAADGAWVHLCPANDTLFGRFVRTAGLEHLLDDPRFATHQARMNHVEEIEAEVAQWVGRYDADQVVTFMDEAGVPSAKVATMEDVVSNPQLRHRNQIMDVEHAKAGTIPMQGLAIQFGDTPMALRRAAPSIGEHNLEVLEEWLGRGRAALDRLREAGAV